MAELLKQQLSWDKIIELSNSIARQAKAYEIEFNHEKFEHQLLLLAAEHLTPDCKQSALWESLTLMQRLKSAARALQQVMPEAAGADVVLQTLQQDTSLSGWLSLVCCEYVGIHQRLSIEQGLFYLQLMTEYFSAEFAIRHLILREPQQVVDSLSTWLSHKNHHVRRLISEGTRPRLPWGVRLAVFISHPEMLLPLLTALRDDPEEYVRRSVANHLNDIAKDHPQLVIEITRNWLSSHALQHLSQHQQVQRTRLLRHACRTLFKQGNREVLSLFGYGCANDINCELTLHNADVCWGGELAFELILKQPIESTLSHACNRQYMIDYVIFHQKANGVLTPKVFKWLDRKHMCDQDQVFLKKHSFKAISTRRYYPGLHRIEIMINGIKKAEATFELRA